jgi:hypothetical protein
MDGACRPQLHSHNNIINLKAMDSPKATYERSWKSERMSPNPTDYGTRNPAAESTASTNWNLGVRQMCRPYGQRNDRPLTKGILHLAIKTSCLYTQMGIHRARPASVHMNQQVHFDLLPN